MENEIHLSLGEGVVAVAFADDLALVVTARRETEVMIKMDGVTTWISEKGLDLASAKNQKEKDS